jgi:hypothetical protein
VITLDHSNDHVPFQRNMGQSPTHVLFTIHVYLLYTSVVPLVVEFCAPLRIVSKGRSWEWSKLGCCVDTKTYGFKICDWATIVRWGFVVLRRKERGGLQTLMLETLCLKFRYLALNNDQKSKHLINYVLA